MEQDTINLGRLTYDKVVPVPGRMQNVRGTRKRCAKESMIKLHISL